MPPGTRPGAPCARTTGPPSDHRTAAEPGTDDADAARSAERAAARRSLLAARKVVEDVLASGEAADRRRKRRGQVTQPPFLPASSTSSAAPKPAKPASTSPVKLWSFGLGNSSRALVDSIAAKHPDVQPSKLLMPYRPPASAGDGDGEGWEAPPRPELRASGPVGPSGGGEWGPDEWSARPCLIATPATVFFRDFEPGKRYRKVVTVTNQHRDLSHFKIESLPDEVRDNFIVQCRRPGLFPSGMSRALEIEFAPAVGGDISTEIVLKTPLDYLRIPVVCTTRNAFPVFRTPDVAFTPSRPIQIGRSVTRRIVIQNQGALPIDFGFLPHADLVLYTGTVQNAVPEDGLAAFADDSDFAVGGPRSLGPYEQVSLPVTFRPRAAGAAAETLVLCYKLSTSAKTKSQISPTSKPPQADYRVSEQTITLTGACEQQPIALEQDVLDFKCCHFDRLYRERLVVHNSGPIALKCAILQNPDLAEAIECAPRMGFCQAGERFEFNLKFHPTRTLLEKYGDERGMIELRMRLLVPDQVLPVTFTIRAQVTAGDLVLAPTQIDFGACPVGSAVAVPLTIHNPGLLPCHFGFHSSAKGTQVVPGEGYGYILPGETITRKVVHKCTHAGRHRFQLECYTLLKQRFSVQCTAEGWVPPLRLSALSVGLPMTPLHETTAANLFIHNTSAHTCDFQFGLPDRETLSISPSAGTLPAGKRMRVLVRHHPKPPPAEAGAAEGHGDGEAAAEAAAGSPEAGAAAAEGEGAEGEGAEGAEGAGAEDAEAEKKRSQKQTHMLSFFMRKSGLDGAPPGEVQVVPLAVHTCIGENPLQIQGPAQLEELKGCKKLNFGRVVIGDKVVVKLLCTNTSTRTLDLESNHLDSSGTFTILNALRRVEGGERYALYLQFCPTICSHYHETLVLKTGISQARIVLTGSGISPNLSIQPEDLTEKVIDFGDHPRAGTKTVEFSIQNNEEFDVEFKTRQQVVSEPFSYGPPTFYCTPAMGTVKAQTTRTMRLIFTAFDVAGAEGRYESTFDLLTASNSVMHSLRVSADVRGEGVSLLPGTLGRPARAQNFPLSPSMHVRQPRAVYALPEKDAEGRNAGTLVLHNSGPAEVPFRFRPPASDSLTLEPREGVIKAGGSVEVAVASDASKRLESKVLEGVVEGALMASYRHPIACVAGEGADAKEILAIIES